MKNDERENHGRLFLRYRQTGETAAFETLLEAYRVPLHSYLTRMLGRRDRAEDAFQEVWLRIVRRAETYDEHGQFSSWLFRIAHNYCLDEYRRSGRDMTIQEPETGTESSFWSTIPDSREPHADEELYAKELQAQIDKAVESLPPRLKEIYLLRTVAEVPFKELATMFDCPLGTVLGWMHQAMKRLREHLIETGSVPEGWTEKSEKRPKRTKQGRGAEFVSLPCTEQ